MPYGLINIMAKRPLEAGAESLGYTVGECLELGTNRHAAKDSVEEARA